MSTVLHPGAAPVYAPRLSYSLEALRGGLLWLTGLFGAFVFMEPSPYEVISLLAIVAFAVTGLTLSPALLPLAALLVLYNFGFAIAVIPVLDQPKTLLWILVSAYLGTTALFFAAALGHNTAARLRLLINGYVVAATAAALAGIVGYFHLVPGTGLFVLYDRARGTFNDPNVLGAFLVLPAILAYQRVLAGRIGQAMRAGVLLLILLAGLFLSFSRGAWAQFVIAAALLMALEFVTTTSTRARARIVLLAILGVVAIAGFVAALLSIDRVASLFETRASLDQSYDVGHTGRFGRHILGALLVLDTPLGIGPLQFHKIFPEDPHNVFLNAFVSGGWLSGFSYLVLTATTLVMGLRFCFVTTPWRPSYLAVYATFVGLVVEGLIIDSDHWRHYYLVLGVLWGLMAAGRAHRMARPGTGFARPVRTPGPSGLEPGGRAA
jgi:hypothetical protein